MPSPDATYEDRFGRISRRAQRLARFARWHGKRLTGRPTRILAEIRWRLGDEVMAMPVYEALKTAHPDAQLSVLCNFPDLLRDNPFVDAVNPDDPSPDRYILLRGAARTRFRPQVHAEKAGVGLLPRPRLHYVSWDTPLAAELPDKPFVAVSTGATWPTKRWPAARWQRLGAQLIEAGHELVQVGRNDERIGSGHNFVDRTSVYEAACLLRRARLFICGDSGLMHVALAADVPVLALFGPTDPTILVRDDPRLHVIRNARACQGCWNTLQMAQEGVCPLHIPGCMETITADQVFAEAARLLAD